MCNFGSFLSDLNFGTGFEYVVVDLKKEKS